MTDNAQLKALDAALDKIRSDYGNESVIDMSESAIKQVDAIPTGALPLDIALGIGGLPVGRMVELFGPESSGKTTLCYHVIASVQAAGGVAAFIDTEHAMDAQYAANLGVNIEKLIVSQPETGEEALNIADVLASSGAVRLIVIDSVAALTPKAELEGEVGDQTIGLLARMMSQGCRKLRGVTNRNNCTILFTNQIREKIGVMFGSPETQPGGRALKFYSSVRLDIRRIETIKNKEGEAVSNRVRVKVVKNKVAPPFKQAEFNIVYGKGVDKMQSLLDLGLEKDVALVTKAGAFYTFVASGEKLQGAEKAKVYMNENPQIAEEIDQRIRALRLGSEESRLAASEVEEVKEEEVKEAADEVVEEVSKD